VEAYVCVGARLIALQLMRISFNSSNKDWRMRPHGSEYAPPEASTADEAEAATRELLGLVPEVGAGLKALVELAFPSLLSRRRDEWMRRVGAALERLEREQRLDVKRLGDDEGL
jgi:hypothetical protein